VSELFIGTVCGERYAGLVPPLPDDAPPQVLEGLVRHRIVLTGGVCPCGAVLVLPNRQQRRAAQRRGEVLHVRIEHEDGCPAIDEVLIPAIQAWKRGRRE
jgi:hypothetical protein